MKKKRILFIALIIIMLSGLSITAYAGNGSSGKHKVAANKKKALKAYAKILHKKKYVNYYFTVCDISGDGIPELLLADDWGTPLAIKEYYTYSRGKAVKLKKPSGKEEYPYWGTLYSMPSRKSFAFYRGGPATTDENDNSIMPYTLIEYKIKNNRIKRVNSVGKEVYTDLGRTKYYFNGKRCSVSKYNKVKKAFKKRMDCIYNSKANRRKYHVD